MIAIDRNVQCLSFRGFWVGDFIVGTMVFGIVLTMEKIGLSGFEAVCFRSKQFNGDCTPIAPIALNFQNLIVVESSRKKWLAGKRVLLGQDFFVGSMIFGVVQLVCCVVPGHDVA